jgi:hypothetical protein
MEGVAIRFQVHRVKTQDGPDLGTQKRHDQPEAGPEYDPVEPFRVSVRECHGRLIHRLYPRPDLDPTFGDKRQILLAEGDTGGEQRRVRRRSTILFRATTGLDHDFLELAVDRGRRQGVVRQRSVPREHPVIRRNSSGEFGQNVTLTPLTHHDAAGAAEGQFGGDLQGADRATCH